MNRDELHSRGQAAFGPQWQTPMARRLDVSPRTIRRWASGEWPVPDDKANAIRRLAGMIRDAWIIGTDPDGDREYVVHARPPRFIARVATDRDEDADTLSGVTYVCASGETLCEVVWLDPPPQDMLPLFQQAETALDIYTADSFEANEEPNPGS